MKSGDTTELLIIGQAQSPEQITQVRELFLEYAKSLGFSLCFQNFDQELAGPVFCGERLPRGRKAWDDRSKRASRA